MLLCVFCVIWNHVGIEEWRSEGETSRHRGGVNGDGDAADRLSALPDGVLHHVMSFLKAWAVVRTCVLSRRWRHLWASAPCVDLRIRYFRLDSEPPEEPRDFPPPGGSSDPDELFDNEDANAWIRTAIKHNARFIHLTGHRTEIGVLKHRALVSTHLKILKLSYRDIKTVGDSMSAKMQYLQSTVNDIENVVANRWRIRCSFWMGRERAKQDNICAALHKLYILHNAILPKPGSYRKMRGRRRAGHVFDEMPPKKAKLSADDCSGGDSAAAGDRISALPDVLLHHVMSFLRAWEVVRTCVLSRRWRHLWASAPCVDLRVWRGGGHLPHPEEFAKFAYRFLLEREVSAPVDTLRALSSPVCDPEVEDYSTCDVDAWIRSAIKRRARVIQISHHPKDEAFCDFDHVPIISGHLKHLKLSSYLFQQRTLMQLSSQCPSLEVLELKDCYLEGHQISSASLKILTIVECRIMEGFTIASPNLVSLRCITPYHRAPLFENVGSLTLDAATIVLDDSFLYAGYEYQYKDIDEDAIEGSGSEDGEGSLKDSDYDSDAVSDASTCEYSEIANNYDDDKQLVEHGEVHNRSKGNYHGYDHRYKARRYRGYRKNKFNGGKVLRGDNALHSLSNARSLELLADAGEVILNRELKTCPTFSNLKTLSLGEWCMGADFGPLISFLQHSPNLENLFLELKLAFPPDHGNVKLEESCQGAAPVGSEVQASALIMLGVQHLMLLLSALELYKCSLHGSEISSTSLKSLTMVKCRIMADLTIAAPNLVSLRCIKPYNRAPLFEDIGSLTLATGTIVLDDSVLFVGFDYEYKDFDEDAIDGSNSDDGEGCTSDSDYDDSDAVSEANTCEYSEIADDYDDEKQHQEHGEGHNQIEDDYDDENQDEEHSEEHNQMGHDEVLGGHNVLHILSNARNLELLADGGEVILNRELKTCPTFRNLKTLSLGEWCMGADFDPLVTFLQHSPNLERLFLELKLDYYSIQAMKGVTKPVGRSFACTHLKMVKIKCSMDDARVHWLAQLFRTNGLPIENIFTFPPDHSNVKLEGGCHDGAAPVVGPIISYDLIEHDNFAYQSSEVQASALIMLEVQHLEVGFFLEQFVEFSLLELSSEVQASALIMLEVQHVMLLLSTLELCIWLPECENGLI
uniref:F-box domain-containing protein n=1 Tax=Oryza punctata TaxID=4537 RepID=A0A0E0LS61_ORYPU